MPICTTFSRYQSVTDSNDRVGQVAFFVEIIPV